MPKATSAFEWSTRNNDGRSTTLSGTLTQSILDFSKWTARKSAQELARRGDSLYMQAEQDLSIRVATAYFAVLTAEDSVAFSQAEEKALSRQLDQAQQRFEVGLSAITDVNEAKAQHDSARAATISAQNALDDAREALREITAKEPTELARLRAELPMQEPVPNDMQAWVDKAVAENPGTQGAGICARRGTGEHQHGTFRSPADAVGHGQLLAQSELGHWRLERFPRHVPEQRQDHPARRRPSPVGTHLHRRLQPSRACARPSTTATLPRTRWSSRNARLCAIRA